MPKRRASTKARLSGAERALRATSLFLAEPGEFSLSVAVFGHPVRREHWIERLGANLADENVHLTPLHLPEKCEPRLIDELTVHLRDVPTSPGHRRAVVVDGMSHHLPDAATPHLPFGHTPSFLAEANLDRELFSKRCPHPLLLCVTPTSLGQLRRHAPDLMHWCSHTFDFTEPALPDGSYPIRGISELEQARPGTIYANRHEMLRAAGIFRAGLDAAIAAHGREHRETMMVRANLINVLDQLGRTPEALVLAEENAHLIEKIDAISDVEVARASGQLAYLLAEMGRYSEAEPLMRRALAIREATLGAQHYEVAIDLNNLAQLLQDTNRSAEAEPMMRRALALDESFYGEKHASVARDINNLAQLLKDTDRLQEAEQMMRRAVAFDEASPRAQQANITVHMNNLAQLLMDTGRLTEAESMMRRVLAIDEASLGQEHPKVARDLNNLAVLLQETGRLADAEPLIRRALNILVASFGDEHPSSIIARGNLASLIEDTKK